VHSTAPPNDRTSTVATTTFCNVPRNNVNVATQVAAPRHGAEGSGGVQRVKPATQPHQRRTERHGVFGGGGAQQHAS
jgi:hypothetical protein